MKTYYYDTKVTRGFSTVIKIESGQGLGKVGYGDANGVRARIKDIREEMSDRFSNGPILELNAQENTGGVKEDTQEEEIICLCFGIESDGI